VCFKNSKQKGEIPMSPEKQTLGKNSTDVITDRGINFFFPLIKSSFRGDGNMTPELNELDMKCRSCGKWRKSIIPQRDAFICSTMEFPMNLFAGKTLKEVKRLYIDGTKGSCTLLIVEPLIIIHKSWGFAVECVTDDYRIQKNVQGMLSIYVFFHEICYEKFANEKGISLSAHKCEAKSHGFE
jgi:hypothetical protein